MGALGAGVLTSGIDSDGSTSSAPGTPMPSIPATLIAGVFVMNSIAALFSPSVVGWKPTVGALDVEQVVAGVGHREGVLRGVAERDAAEQCLGRVERHLRAVQALA